jgi:hypothetical protein
VKNNPLNWTDHSGLCTDFDGIGSIKFSPCGGGGAGWIALGGAALWALVVERTQTTTTFPGERLVDQDAIRDTAPIYQRPPDPEPEPQLEPRREPRPWWWPFGRRHDEGPCPTNSNPNTYDPFIDQME